MSVRGFTTATEAFAAIEAGASALKLFPAGAGGAGTLGALKAVLPPDVPVFTVGGIELDTMEACKDAGANGFGLGSNLYKPGMTRDCVHAEATKFAARTQELWYL